MSLPSDSTADSGLTEHEQLTVFLESLHLHRGYDFRNYAHASLLRRVRLFQLRAGAPSFTDLMTLIQSDDEVFADFLRSLSVTVTEMFRDPAFFLELRNRFIPWLETWPFVRVWHAGCATGEEAWSMAILLQEVGLLSHTQLYATDLNEESLDVARTGIYRKDRLDEYRNNYQAAGGNVSFDDYYLQRYDSFRLSRALQKHITFANHNLVTDGVFSEMHLVLCRNVLIYFNRDLQDRVLTLFRDSLCHGGLLCLGPRETLRFSCVADDFELVSEPNKIYRLRGPK